MDSSYNFATGQFGGTYRESISFDLAIRTPITQIYGDSDTEKTFLLNYARNEIQNKKYNFNEKSNIYVFDTANIDALTIDKLKSFSQYLIIIDRCDLILTDESILRFIAGDRNNHYLLFSRTTLPIGLSPNYYGEFILDKGKISIQYNFNERCWF